MHKIWFCSASVVPLNRTILSDLQKFYVKKENKICIHKNNTKQQISCSVEVTEQFYLTANFTWRNTNVNK